MSVEIMLFATIKSVNVLTKQVADLTEVTAELVEVTKAVHRERAAQIRQEVEELNPEDHPHVNNFKMWHLQERLKALEMPVRTLEHMAAIEQMPYLPRKAG